MTRTIPDRLYKAQFAQDVHDNFRRMRERAPVFKAKFTRFKPAYLVTRYDDVLALLGDDCLIKNPRSAKPATGRSTDIWLPQSFPPLLHNMLNSDEPDHRRLRNLVHQAFSPRVVERLQPRIEDITQRLLDNLERQFSNGQSVEQVARRSRATDRLLATVRGIALRGFSQVSRRHEG